MHSQLHARARRFVLAAALLAGSASYTQTLVAQSVVPEWQLLPEDSSLEFVVDVMELATDGVFRTFDATVTLDRTNLSGARIDATIQTGSAYIGIRDADLALPTAEWFDSINWPQAEFSANNVRHLGGDRYLANAILRLKSKEQSFDFRFAWREDGNTATLHADAEFERLDFDIGTGEFLSAETVAHRVHVTIDSKFERAPAR